MPPVQNDQYRPVRHYGRESPLVIRQAIWEQRNRLCLVRLLSDHILYRSQPTNEPLPLPSYDPNPVPEYHPEVQTLVETLPGLVRGLDPPNLPKDSLLGFLLLDQRLYQLSPEQQRSGLFNYILSPEQAGRRRIPLWSILAIDPLRLPVDAPPPASYVPLP